jgi:tryptophan-rich sensory protein
VDSTSYLLRALLIRWPTLLLFVVGVLYAIISWRRHPKVSLLALSGLFLWQLEAWAFLFINQRLPDLARADGLTLTQMSFVYLAMNLTQDFLFSVALILLVAAALVQRGDHQTI